MPGSTCIQACSAVCSNISSIQCCLCLISGSFTQIGAIAQPFSSVFVSCCWQMSGCYCEGLSYPLKWSGSILMMLFIFLMTSELLPFSHPSELIHTKLRLRMRPGWVYAMWSSVGTCAWTTLHLHLTFSLLSNHPLWLPFCLLRSLTWANFSFPIVFFCILGNLPALFFFCRLLDLASHTRIFIQGELWPWFPFAAAEGSFQH